MLDLDRQLRDYGGYMDELAPDIDGAELEPVELVVPGRAPRHWRALAAAAVAATMIAGAGAVAAGRDGGHRVKTLNSTPTATTAATTANTTPPATTANRKRTPTTAARSPIVDEHPTFAQQVAQLEKWSRGAVAEAPGGRPILEAEAVFCDYGVQQAGVGNMAGQFLFASYFPLDQPLTEARLVDGCGRHDPGAAPVQTPSGDERPYQLCSTHRRGPNYDPDTKVTDPPARPVVAFGATDCATAGYEAFPGPLMQELNHRREVEIEMRAVPTNCPTRQEAAAWAGAVTARELGHAWPIASQLATDPVRPDLCYQPMLIDWDIQRVILGQFAAGD